MLPRLKLIWADAGYRGSPFAEWVKEQLGWLVKVVKRPAKWIWVAKGAQPPPAPLAWHAVGSWSERSAGSVVSGGSLATMKLEPQPAKC